MVGCYSIHKAVIFVMEAIDEKKIGACIFNKHTCPPAAWVREGIFLLTNQIQGCAVNEGINLMPWGKAYRNLFYSINIILP